MLDVNMIVYSRKEDGTWEKVRLIREPGQLLPKYIKMRTTTFEKIHGYAQIKN